MVPRILAVSLLVGLASAAAQAQSKSTLPQLIVAARFVLVTTVYGTELSPKVPPEARRAVANVQAAIQRWRRYTLVYKPEAADLILVVRKGRIAAVTPGVSVGRSSEGERRTGVSLDIEGGMPYDLLAVYNAHTGGLDSAPLWRATQKDGLNPPDLPLFKKFQDEVEHAVKHP